MTTAPFDNIDQNKQDTHGIADTKLTRDPFLPSEKAFRTLLPFLQSNVPWNVTSTFLFNVCHILENILAVFGISTSNPSSNMLIPVLRTMRVWRFEGQERKDLRKLAADLAGLVDIELSATNSKHTKESRDGLSQEYFCGKTEPQQKENIRLFRILPRRQHRSSKTMRRTTTTPDVTDPPHAVCTSVLHCGGCKASVGSTSRHHSCLGYQAGGILSYPELPTPLLTSCLVAETSNESYTVLLDSTQFSGSTTHLLLTPHIPAADDGNGTTAISIARKS